MASFDPYRKWLGIPPEEQPPHHYRLLGIGLFESDPDVIANAADRQMSHVRSFQSGKYASLSQTLLNELSSARLCLLDPHRRAAYDAALKAKQSAGGSLPAPSVVPPMPGTVPPGPPPKAGPVPGVAPSAMGPIGRVMASSARSYPKRHRNNVWQVPLVVFGLLTALALGVALLWAMGQADSNAPTQTNGTRTRRTQASLPEIRRDWPRRRPARSRPQGGDTPPNHRRPPAGLTSPGPLRPGEMAAMRGHDGPVVGAAFALDGLFAITGGRDKTVRLWDTSGGYELRQFRGAADDVLAVGFSGDGETVYALTGRDQVPGDAAIRAWDTGIGGDPKSTPVADGRRALSFAVAPDGLQAAIGCHDGTIRLIELPGGKEVRAFSGHSGEVHCVVFSPDGAALLSGGEDGNVLAFNRHTGAEARRFKGHQGPVLALDVAPDGLVAMSGGEDQIVRMWDLRGNKQRAELRGHEQPITSIAFAPIGERALSADRGGTLMVWHVADACEQRRFSVPGGPVLAVAVAPEGNRAVVTGQDGVVRLWGLVDPVANADAPRLDDERPIPDDLRVAVPDESEQQKWKRHIRDTLFQADFANAKQPAEKVVLAEKLLGRARESQSDPVAAYAFFDLARHVAGEAGDLELALGAVEGMAERYNVDGLAAKLELFQTIAAGTRDAAARDTLSGFVLSTVDEAAKQEQFAVAEQLVALARKTGGSAVDRATDAAAERLKETRLAFEAAERARATLDEQPQDAQAALALGKYECFVQGDWPTGLPLLARGADEPLAETAMAELGQPSDPQAQLALADAWWQIAESAPPRMQGPIRWHAAYWYKRAEPHLDGNARDQVQARILAAVDPALAPATREAPPSIPDLTVGRSDRMREKLLRHYGGDTETEAAVGRALEWIVQHQFPEGYWNFNHQGPNQQNRSADPGTLEAAPNAATALALLPLLGAGNTPRRGDYRRHVMAGINFLRARMVPVAPDVGTLFEPEANQMPSHAMATCALCEAAAMASDAQSMRTAQAAVNFILNTQNADGGWAYLPRRPDQRAEPSNIFATAWNLQALMTAQWAGLKVPEAKMKSADGFLRSFLTAGGQADPTGAAAARLAHLYVDWNPDQPEWMRFAAAASEEGPSASGHGFQDYCTAQVLREFGGQPWVRFRSAMRRQLLDTQARDGPEEGSWYLDGSAWNNRAGGRLFSTALATLILETYYRHPPLEP